MSRIITLECDAKEVRIAVGVSGLTGVSIDKVLSIPIELPDGVEPWGSEAATVGLRNLMTQAGLKSGSAIACVSRNDIELRSIMLPDVDANELPDMVRFAAPRYFANVTEQWPIDFITMPSHHEGSVDCIVGAMNPGLIQKIDRMCAAAGLELEHMVLRPMAAVAGAMARNPEWLQESVLFVDVLNEEADIVISELGNSIFMRSFSAPGDLTDPETVKILSGEIKRSLLAAASQRTGLTVDRIVLWSQQSLTPLAEALGQAVDLPVAMLNPFAWADKADLAIAATTETVGRFAPILGAFSYPQQKSRLIDFSHPRKRVEKKVPVARYAMAGALALALLGSAVWWYFSSHAQLDQEAALLRSTIANEAESVKLAKKHAADWRKIEGFLKGDIHWMDELATLSARAQDPDNAYFGVTTFMLEPRSNSASISAKYFTKVQDMVPQVQAAYRDDRHTVRGTAVTPSQNKEYPWASDLTITLPPAEVPDPRKEAMASPAATDSTLAPKPDGDLGSAERGESRQEGQPNVSAPESPAPESPAPESSPSDAGPVPAPDTPPAPETPLASPKDGVILGAIR